MKMQEWIDLLEDVIAEEVGEDTNCSGVALSEHPQGGLVANIFVKADYDESIDEIRQVNIMFVPDCEIMVEEEITIDNDDHNAFDGARID